MKEFIVISCAWLATFLVGFWLGYLLGLTKGEIKGIKADEKRIEF